MRAETEVLPVLVLNATFASVLQETGEKTDFAQSSKEKENRLARWKRQEIARALIPSFRVSKCCRVQVSDVVQVLRSKQYHSAHYGKLSTCASVWVCPICSSKITERKRAEIASALSSELGKHYSKFIVTTTLQHKSEDKTEVLIQGLKAGKRQFTSGWWYQNFKAKWKIAGTIYGTEFTYGQKTGCHAHGHDLIFSELPRLSAQDVQSIRDEYSARFVEVMDNLGFYVSAEHGVAVESSNDAGALYVAKMGLEVKQVKSDQWGADWEMAKGSLKVSKGDRFTPFELLDLSKTGNGFDGAWAEEKFKEYAYATKKITQLRWSPGLRSVLGLGVEMSDDDIAAAHLEKDVIEFAEIFRETWQEICKRKLRGYTLEVARDAESVDLFASYLAGLRYLPQGLG